MEDEPDLLEASGEEVRVFDTEERVGRDTYRVVILPTR